MLKNKIQNYTKGFSLIELLVVISILSILAGVSIPKYRSYSEQSKRNSVKPTLAYIYNLFKINYVENGTFKNTKLTNASLPEGYCITASTKGSTSEQPSPRSIGNCSGIDIEEPSSGFVIIAHGKSSNLNVGINHREEFVEEKSKQQMFIALTKNTTECSGYTIGKKCRQAGCYWDIVKDVCEVP